MNYTEEQYICKKSFIISKCDDNGEYIEGEAYQIREGSIWYKKETSSIGDIRLGNEIGWLELDSKSVTEHFERAIYISKNPF